MVGACCRRDLHVLVHNASQPAGTPQAGKPCDCDLGQTLVAGNPELEQLQAKLAAEAGRVLQLILHNAPKQITIGSTKLKTGQAVRGPVLTVLIDRKTGKVYYGQSHDDIPSPIEATIAKAVADRQVDEVAWKGHINRWGIPGRHSEVFALNDALLARNSVKDKTPVCDFSEFAVFNVRTVDFESGKIGDPIHRCGNCRNITGAMLDLSYGPNVIVGLRPVQPRLPGFDDS